MASEPAASSPAATSRRTAIGGSGRRRQPPRVWARLLELGRGQVAVGGGGWLGGGLQRVYVAPVDPLEQAQGHRLQQGELPARATDDPFPLGAQRAGHDRPGDLRGRVGGVVAP